MGAGSTSQILLAMWRQQDPARRWRRRGFAGLVLAGLLTALALLSSWQSRIALGGTTAAMALLIGWPLLVSNLLEQNHPIAARLVPSHRARLVRAALLAWLAISGLSALLMWSTLPLQVPLFAWWLLTAAAGVWLAQALRHWSLWVLMWMGPSVFGAFRLGHHLAPLGRRIGDLWLQQPLLYTAMALALMAALVAQMFGRGDERHRILHHRTECMRRAMRGQLSGTGTASDVFGRVGRWTRGPVQRGVDAWQRYLLATARPTRASVMSRAEVVLHGQQHWVSQALGTLLVLAFVALCFAVVIVCVDTHFTEHWKSGALGMSIGLISMSVNPAWMLPVMLWRTRREQALLKLVPGMPQGIDLNRAVAGMQLRHSLIAWLLGAACEVALARAANQPGLVAFSLAALPVCAMSPLAPPALRSGDKGAGIALATLVYIVLAVGMELLYERLQVPLGVLTAVSVLITATGGYWRWRRVISAPTALPAGRLA